MYCKQPLTQNIDCSWGEIHICATVPYIVQLFKLEPYEKWRRARRQEKSPELTVRRDLHNQVMRRKIGSPISSKVLPKRILCCTSTLCRQVRRWDLPLLADPLVEACSATPAPRHACFPSPEALPPRRPSCSRLRFSHPPQEQTATQVVVLPRTALSENRSGVAGYLELLTRRPVADPRWFQTCS